MKLIFRVIIWTIFFTPAMAVACTGTDIDLDFSGKVTAGETYTHPLSIKYGLSFHLAPNDHGWTMSIENKAGNDMIYPVNPPYRFNPLQFFDGSYGEHITKNEVRSFRFLYGLKPDGYKYIQSHLENILWPMTMGDQEEGLKGINAFPQGKGTITIPNVETSEPAPDGPDKTETVKMMEFRVHLEAPKGYFLDNPEKCP